MQSNKEELIELLNVLDESKESINMKQIRTKLHIIPKSLRYNRFRNNIVRLSSINLIESNGTDRRIVYKLSARGHTAVLNKFKNSEYLYPHTERFRPYISMHNNIDHIPSEDAKLHMLFYSITKPRIPCWE